MFYHLTKPYEIPLSVLAEDLYFVCLLFHHTTMAYNLTSSEDVYSVAINNRYMNLIEKEKILDLTIKQPDVIKTKLYEYQLNNIKWMLDYEVQLSKIYENNLHTSDITEQTRQI